MAAITHSARRVQPSLARTLLGAAFALVSLSAMAALLLGGAVYLVVRGVGTVLS